MTRQQAKELALSRSRQIEHITVCRSQPGDFELFEFCIVSTPVVARARKIRGRWTAEFEQELHTVPDQ